MNHRIVPDFNMEDDGYSIPTSSDFFFDKHLKMPEEELVELLWQNGQVVMHNQTQRPPRKTPERFHNGDGSALLHHVLPNKSAACDGDGGGGGAGPSSAPEQQLHIQEDEMASWLQYPIDDSFDRDFCSDLFYPPAGSCQPAAPAAEPSSSSPKPKVPPIPPPEADKVAANFALFSRLTGKAPQAEPPRVSTSTSTAAAPLAAEREVGGGDPPVKSSSGGSGDWPSNPPAADDRKRKRGGDELEDQKELSLRIVCRVDGEKNAEFDHADEKKPARSARRTRAAEVHNLSERRRRDRINEKMKALQELIPHCNKSDKASMLDEAIEYLKSLQFQVQMMSMGCGMAPMVYPGVQHYISPMGMRMGMGMGMGMGMAMDMASGSLNRPMLPFQPVLPPMPIHGVASHLGQRLPIPPLHMSHVPPSDQPRAQATSQTDAAFNLVALQIPNARPLMNLPDPYQHYLSFHPLPMAPQTETAVTAPNTSGTTEAPDSKKSG